MTRFIKLFSASAAVALAIGVMTFSSMASDDDDKKQGREESSSYGNCDNAGKRHGMGHHKGHHKGMKRGQHMGADGKMPGQRGFMRRFSIIDKNSDDRIGADEAAAWRESVFAAMDSDDDNELTMDEFMAVRMGKQQGRNPQRQAMRQEKKKARFKPMDVDNSGKVSIAEFMNAGKIRFEKADADGDGKVTPWEFRAQRRSR